MLAYFSGAFLGWGVGANDSANIFGTAVTSRMVSYKRAVVYIAIFSILGAISAGGHGVETLRSVTTVDSHLLSLVTLAAGCCVAVMTFLCIPISTSQALGGALFGIAILNNDLNFQVFRKMIICWVATPIGAVFIAAGLYLFFAALLRFFRPGMFLVDALLRTGLILCGCYGAFSLGANNVANCATVFTGEGMLSTESAVLVGGILIAIGAITYSRRVMLTVGKGIVQLDAFSSFICVLSHSVTLHIFAQVGVPVSSSQAVVGSVLGISLIKGFHLVDFKVLFKVFLGWGATPFIGAIAAIILSYII